MENSSEKRSIQPEFAVYLLSRECLPAIGPPRRPRVASPLVTMVH